MVGFIYLFSSFESHCRVKLVVLILMHGAFVRENEFKFVLGRLVEFIGSPAMFSPLVCVPASADTPILPRFSRSSFQFE